MGRRSAVADLQNRVREVRQLRGLAQGQLAERAGLTRQAISGIESGHYVPNTTVALQLARALGCRVEELFVLPPAEAAPPLELVGGSGAGSARLVAGRVGDRWLGYPLAAGWELQPGFQSADVLRSAASGHGDYLLTPRDRLEHTGILLGCDPSL